MQSVIKWSWEILQPAMKLGFANIVMATNFSVL